VSIEAVAAELSRTDDPRRRAVLQHIALQLLRIDILRWQIARLRAATCRLDMDAARKGGENDRRDGAAA
jgi:hypothetical protein